VDGTGPKQLAKIDVYYNEAKDSRYVPRAVLIDLDDGTLDTISSGPYGCLFSPDNYLAGQVRCSRYSSREEGREREKRL